MKGFTNYGKLTGIILKAPLENEEMNGKPVVFEIGNFEKVKSKTKLNVIELRTYDYDLKKKLISNLEVNYKIQLNYRLSSINTASGAKFTVIQPKDFLILDKFPEIDDLEKLILGRSNNEKKPVPEKETDINSSNGFDIPF